MFYKLKRAAALRSATAFDNNMKNNKTNLLTTNKTHFSNVEC